MNPFSTKEKKMVAVALIGSLFAVVLLFGIWMVRWQYREADAMLDRWARASGYELLERERDDSSTGPMASRSSSRQVVYHVVVKDEKGRRRTGRVVCGGKSTGVLDNKVSVRWDEP